MDNYNKLFMIIRKTDLLNYDEKNELQLYLMNLKEQVKKQKEVIDKIKNVQIEMPKSNYSYDYMIYRNKIDEILKEVSE